VIERPFMAACRAFQVLVRDNAMVLAMEYVRLIITTDKVMLPPG